MFLSQLNQCDAAAGAEERRFLVDRCLTVSHLTTQEPHCPSTMADAGAANAPKDDEENLEVGVEMKLGDGKDCMKLCGLCSFHRHAAVMNPICMIQC